MDEFFQITYDQEYRYLTYKGKNFRYDFLSFSRLHFFKIYSKQFKEDQKIPLIDNEESTNFDENQIKCFISYCEGEKIQPSEANIYALYFLSEKYQITCLQNQVKEYLSRHQDQILNQILVNGNCNDDQLKPITEDLITFIENDNFASFPIHLLYRIFALYRKLYPIKNDYDVNERENEDKIKEFMFKQLDKKKREASILFCFIDFQNFGEEILDKIDEEYKEIFDYNMISRQIVQFYHIFKKKVNMKKQINIDEFAIKVFNEKKDNIEFPDYLEIIPLCRFYAFDAIVSLIFPSSLKSIHNGAFEKCYSLEKVTFVEKSHLESIGNFAFYECIKLSVFQMPPSVTSIGAGAFRECPNLNISFPPNLKSLGDHAFYGCAKLEEAIIPKLNHKISYSEFFFCTSLRKVEISSNVEIINNYAFYKCTSLQTIKIPSSVKYIGNYAFNLCTSLTKIIFEENSQLTNIGESAFDGCENLLSMNIPFYIQTIGPNAFNKCSKLKLEVLDSFVFYDFASNEFQIPQSFDTIKKSAFYDFLSLTSIKIPSSVKKIEYHTFEKCQSLKTVTFSEDSYLKSIGSFAFSECSKLETISIPSSVKEIEDRAFEKCKSLTAFVFSGESHLEKIGSYCFSECSKLETIEIPSSIKAINNNLFEKCSSLSKVTFKKESRLESIGDSSFLECKKLEKIEIPSSVTIIGNHCFDHCSSLNAVVFGENSRLKTICSSAFFQCESLPEFNIPPSAEYIGDRAFEYCSNLSMINIPPSIQSIGYAAFHGDKKFVSQIVEIPLSVKSIDGYAFLQPITVKRK